MAVQKWNTNHLALLAERNADLSRISGPKRIDERVRPRVSVALNEIWRNEHLRQTASAGKLLATNRLR